MPLVAALLACTSFLLEDGGRALVGKSYDWDMGQGALLYNQAGAQRWALQLNPDDQPAHWTARHASLTFNQYGRGLPNGGINDAGLVVEALWLDESELPARDLRPSVNELEWIQVQLDNYATVQDVMDHAQELRVSLVHGKVHYFACDRTRTCASFEHIHGQLVVTPGPRVLANHSQARASAWAAKHAGQPRGAGSLQRYTRALRDVRSPPPGEAVAAAFRILDDVRAPRTQWNIVYDLDQLKVHFRTRAEPAIRTVSLEQGVACAGADLADPRAQLKAFGEADNRALLAASLHGLPLPPGTLERVAAHESCSR